MKIKRVEHIAIAVDSMKQSLDLMRDTFGLELEYEEQIGATRDQMAATLGEVRRRLEPPPSRPFTLRRSRRPM